MTSPESALGTSVGPVIFAYDGSELAALAIGQSATQLAAGREAVVVCVWQPADVGFTPVTERHFDADKAQEVRKAAEETAAYGASLAEQAGFRARSLAVESAPTWKGIVKTAQDEGASLIVIGSHRHGGLVGHLVGNVASAVVAHAASSVLVVHQPS
ncbi:MAG: arabinose efflux permease family protein [Frankiales bacterium]|nr:arabinose efflux permease family protein [Frankiales bacterium]